MPAFPKTLCFALQESVISVIMYYMKNNKLFPVAVIALALILVPLLSACSSTPVSAAAANSIGQKLNCVCGSCSLVASVCATSSSEDCATSKKQMSQIRKGLAAGHSEEQIIKDMLGIYGQRVLAQ